MIRGIVIAILVFGLAGTAYWGYQEHRDKNAVMLNAENSYQRAFHDLSYHMDLLHDKIGTTLAMNSRQSLSPALIEVWRIASQAHNEVGQLPLTLLPFNKTEDFLINVGNFSYQTAVKDVDKTPLSNNEYNTLKKLYNQSGAIRKDLRNVQHMVLKNNLRLMDVEMALASGKENTDNAIIDGFKTVEKTASGYSETDMNPALTSMPLKDETFKQVTGKAITPNKAVSIAKKYTGMNGTLKIKVTRNGKGSDYGFYSVSLKNKQTNEEANMDMTIKGGHPIWYINSRKLSKQRIGLHDAGNKAAAFLKKAGFDSMQLFESMQYDNTGVFVFVTVQDHIRIYPESVKVKVALDNGSIIGLAAEEYLQSHNVRKISAPIISQTQARGKINPSVKVMEENEAIIINQLNQEVLCYEFLGVAGKDTYRIFINADNGQEEKVEKLTNSEEISENVM